MRIGTLSALVCLALPVGMGALSCQETARHTERRAYEDSAQEPLGPLGFSEWSQAVGLYRRHCVICHGPSGDGQGVAAGFLFPPARDFTQGRFRLASTVNGMPTDGDLIAVLKRGMPGSSMPPFGWLHDEELELLASYVRQLAAEGMAEQIAAEAREAGEMMRGEQSLELAQRRLRPGALIEVGEPRPHDPQTLETGKQLYMQSCAPCHGEDGRGRQKEPRWNEDGSLNWARDFTAGHLKGGASHEELVWRIRGGIPGTAMSATLLEDPAETAALAAYVQSLIPAGAKTRLVRRHRTLQVPRIEGSVPSDAADPRWDSASELDLVLAPLAWHDDAIFEARVAFVHDGEQIAVRVRWEDPSADWRVLGDSEYPDAVALQFSSEASPPLFGMGSHQNPVNIWHWKAFHASDGVGLLDIFEGPVHTLVDALTGEVSVMDAPLYLPSQGVTAPSDEGASVQAEGPESVRRSFYEGLSLSTRPSWEHGRWSVVFSRPLAPRSRGEVSLLPGSTVQMACAVWNGSAGEHHGQKSISIWQLLQVDP